MSKPSIAIYLQHFLSPSMTFVFRQLISAENRFYPFVFCSDKLENQDKFPFNRIYHMQQNFLRLKKFRGIDKILGWNYFFGINPKLSFQQKKYFKEKLLLNNIKLIHAHFGPSGLEILNTAQSLELPLIVTFHGYDASVLLHFKKYRNKLKNLFKFAHVITVSEQMKQKLIEIGASEENMSVIRCGIPVEIFSFKERIPVREKIKSGSEIIFLQVSNFVEKKGHQFTVYAFKNFLEHFSNLKLILAGEGPLKTKIQQLCQKLEILDRVSFPGLVNQAQIVDLMNKSDVFLHHSVTTKNGDKEGVPTVIMEAMATGLPVISTIHSGIPELIDNNVNGILVPEKDVNAYTQALISLGHLQLDFGEKARQKVIRNFNLTKETEKLFELYDNIMKK